MTYIQQIPGDWNITASNWPTLEVPDLDTGLLGYYDDTTLTGADGTDVAAWAPSAGSLGVAFTPPQANGRPTVEVDGNKTGIRFSYGVSGSFLQTPTFVQTMRPVTRAIRLAIHSLSGTTYILAGGASMNATSVASDLARRISLIIGGNTIPGTTGPQNGYVFGQDLVIVARFGASGETSDLWFDGFKVAEGITQEQAAGHDTRWRIGAASTTVDGGLDGTVYAYASYDRAINDVEVRALTRKMQE